jgi:phosphatidate cytidylyltransferase
VSGIWPVYFFSIKYFALTIIFSMIAQTGDLTISYLKRLEKIKDTGKTLPGHGGIFDRIDGLMFVVILTFILYSLKFIGGHFTP